MHPFFLCQKKVSSKNIPKKSICNEWIHFFFNPKNDGALEKNVSLKNNGMIFGKIGCSNPEGASSTKLKHDKCFTPEKWGWKENGSGLLPF